MKTLLHLALQNLHAFLKVCSLVEGRRKIRNLAVNPFDILRVLAYLSTGLLHNHFQLFKQMLKYGF